ncbi:DEAD/DEAH box helicase [Stieleria varia]|uniref:ATP-dependent RNA helicase DeaD n=1 Tax=Stieleria varia TaxID=2528005 RepID=A0A5C6ANI1_9BACT|nr:DEAD/DEAH box helicase [Stieleria varia]TWU01067.1 ATP-dependent RNA helicase DeaD [Stieleria varia]
MSDQNQADGATQVESATGSDHLLSVDSASIESALASLMTSELIMTDSVSTDSVDSPVESTEPEATQPAEPESAAAPVLDTTAILCTDPVATSPAEVVPAEEASLIAPPAEDSPQADAAQPADDEQPPVESKKKRKKRLAAEAAEAELAVKLAALAGGATDASDSSDANSDKNTATGFAALKLCDRVHQAVEQSGYDTPTDIQSEVIPHIMAGRDVLAQSQTGTGKTAAFALPLLSRLSLTKRAPQVLVLAPTRELAMQVADSFATYSEHMSGVRVAAVYGGQDYEIQFRQLKRGVHVVVGTPGRVIDHIKRGTLDLSELDCLVLDEADEMLNMGFLEDVQFVLDQTPERRQVALFSATLPAPIRAIADRYLNDPAKVTVKTKTVSAESIRQRAVFVAPRDKLDVLTRFLEAEKTDGVIVFTKTKDSTVQVAEQLCRQGISAVALNGDMPQKVRERTIEQLKDGRLDVLVATDVAARGLDVRRISHVFNYDLPHDSESYIHRIGRTGRAGRTGEAIIFLTNAQRNKVRLIERATKGTLEVVQAPSSEQINALRVEQFKQQITAVSAEQDLTMFKQLLVDYSIETGKSMEMIAAALAQISLQGRDFLMKERPKRAKTHEAPGREDRAFDGRSDDDRGPRRPRYEIRPVEEGMLRYRIEVGRRDGVKPGNIVGAVANEGGIDSEFIGPITINDGYSTIDLPQGMPTTIFETLQKTRVCGKVMRISVAKDEPSDQDGGYKGSRPSGGYAKRGGPNVRSGKPGGKPGGKFKGGFKGGFASGKSAGKSGGKPFKGKKNSKRSGSR